MALFKNNGQATQKKDEAPASAGADSVSEGMSTENNEALIPGGDKGKKDESDKAPKKVKAKSEYYFYWPAAPMGKCSISIPFPVLDKDGAITGRTEHKQVDLKDKFFKVLKKDMKNDDHWREYQKCMKSAGLEMFSEVTNFEELMAYRELLASRPSVEPKKKNAQKVFGAFHPEHLDSETKFVFAFQHGEEVVRVEMVKGKIFTDDSAFHKTILKNGFSDLGHVKDSQKISKIIEEEKETEKEDTE